MRIYLDTCCYCRAVEFSEQENMRAEIEAVNFIINNRYKNGDVLIGSDVLYEEINLMKDNTKRARVGEKYSFTSGNIRYDNDVFKRAVDFMIKARTREKDSLHLACADIGRADVFLTVDYRLIKAVMKMRLRFEVQNPVWYADKLRKKGGDIIGGLD